ncbi:MAG: hypothetical protein BWX93_01826 [Bacteroidetes bacterium ADurb.Bin139]|jgi:hypothetical protein|nr:MAG: hypothetical protein BWX93_01826 [Bacteroidetes bacterium ADurb.Bin139]
MGTIIFIRSIRRKVQDLFSIACFYLSYHPICNNYSTLWQGDGIGMVISVRIHLNL